LRNWVISEIHEVNIESPFFIDLNNLSLIYKKNHEYYFVV